ncbi:MAG: di-trans,poly-cis-decaprenylcistransferase [Nitrospirae bacterium RIFCSPLOWO2_02_42_7]|nr:MAG: di-trans,poly-cis-decaprenylcistransferase [Nitrospirae bacterium RIFCSPLOWO2_02_42_7]
MLSEKEENIDLDHLSDEELIELMDKDHMPGHIAIIMDGNGRWARMRGLPRIAGHREGIKSVREIVTFCREVGIEVLTIYAFSAENWKRPELEVKALMMFLEEYLQRELKTLMDNNIRFMTIGQTDKLPGSVKKWIEKVEKKTEHNTSMILNIALSYGGRTEIVDAILRIMNDITNGAIKPENIDSKLFSNYLYTKGLPDPDLMIRTSGETRISNFLLWQIAYAELYFTKTLWPDFRRHDLLLAILDYQHRERRFGMIEEQITRTN